MPEPGEIRTGREIGKTGTRAANRQHTWRVCRGCGDEAWIQVSTAILQSKLCRPCAIKGCSREYNQGPPSKKQRQHGNAVV